MPDTQGNQKRVSNPLWLELRIVVLGIKPGSSGRTASAFFTAEPSFQLISLLSYTPQDHLPRKALPTMGWALPLQSSIKIKPKGCLQDNLLGAFSQLRFLLNDLMTWDCFRLVDKNITNTPSLTHAPITTFCLTMSPKINGLEDYGQKVLHLWAKINLCQNVCCFC